MQMKSKCSKNKTGAYQPYIECANDGQLPHFYIVCDLTLKQLDTFQHFWMLHDIVDVWPGSCNSLVPGHAH